MDINQYAYLWTNEMLLIEDEKLANEIINRMLQRGVPVYNSFEDLVNKCAPINIVGQPSLPDDFPAQDSVRKLNADG